MRFRQDFKDFQILQPFYMTAIQSKSASTKKYTLSVDFQGVRIDVMHSKSKIKFAGFSEVIQGAILRFKKLFKYQSLELRVLVHQKPTKDNVGLAVEILSEEKIEIAGELYYVSVMFKYSYDKPGEVTYFPILYREVCSNGMFAKLSSSFKETIPVSEIYDIKCDWSICNFEDYCASYAQVIEDFKTNEFHEEEGFQAEADRLFSTVLDLEVERYARSVTLDLIRENPRDVDAESIIQENRNTLGSNRFAILNALTDFASRQEDHAIRHDMFIKIGNFVSSDIDKKLKDENKKLTDTMFWDDLLNFITR